MPRHNIPNVMASNNVLAESPLRGNYLNIMEGTRNALAGFMGHEPFPNQYNQNPISVGDVVGFGLDVAPGTGDVIAAQDAARFAKQGDYGMAALSGVGVLPFIPALGGIIAGRGAKTFKNTYGDVVEDLKNIDFDFPITHSGGQIKSVNQEGVFDGLFGVPGEHSSSGVNLDNIQTTFYPRKGRVMGEGDIDVDYDKGINFLKEEFPDADNKKIEDLYEIVMEDGNIFNLEVNPLADDGFSDLGEASWEAQRLRGKFAIENDFDAVAMKDETGVSYLIPSGSKAVMKRKPNGGK